MILNLFFFFLFRDMLEQSIQELLLTVEELEKCSEVIKDEGNIKYLQI